MSRRAPRDDEAAPLPANPAAPWRQTVQLDRAGLSKAGNQFGEEDMLPLVPFVPFRCPSCGRHKPRTGRVSGRVRYHQCLACGTRYRSLEMPAGAVDPNYVVDEGELPRA
jgi:hypothetical protein